MTATKAELVDLRGKLAQAKKEAAAMEAELQALSNASQAQRRQNDHKARSQQLLDIEGASASEESGAGQSSPDGSESDGDEVPNPPSSRATKKLRKEMKNDELARRAQGQRKLEERGRKKLEERQKALEQQRLEEERARKKQEEQQDATMKAILSIGFDKAPDGSATMEPSLLCELAESGLERLQPALTRLGYLFPSDLAEALENEGEIDKLAEELGLKDPEKRRLIKAISDAMKRAEQEEERQKKRRIKEKEREAARARQNQRKMAEEQQGEKHETNDTDDESLEAGMTVDIESAHFKRIALLNEMKKLKLERFHDVVTKAGYLFPSDLQEADKQEREDLLELLDLQPPEHRRWKKLIGGEWPMKQIPTEEEEPVVEEVDPDPLTFAQMLERQGLERFEEQLAARGYHGIADFQMEDEDAQEAELQNLTKALEMKPPEMRRLRKALEEEEPTDTTLKQALEEISLGRLHAPLSSKGYVSPADLVEADEQVCPLALLVSKKPL